MSSLGKFNKIRILDNASSQRAGESWERNKAIFVGVLTISDRCARGEKNDLSGPNLQQILQEHTGFRSVIKVYKILPDESDEIVETLVHWSDNLGLELIITTGGTGLGPRDVTPEATAAVIEKDTPGFTIAIITASLKVTSDAMVTRLRSGIRGNTIIINLPGSRKASAECLGVVLPAIPHALECMATSANRTCECANSDVRHESEAKRRLVQDVANRVLMTARESKTPDQEPRNPPDPLDCGHHTAQVFKTPLTNVTEDELSQIDVDVESLLSNEAPTTSTTQKSPSVTSVTKEKRIDDDDIGISVETALDIVTNTTQVLGSEEVGLLDSLGRVLATDISFRQGDKPVAGVSGYALSGAVSQGEIRTISPALQPPADGTKARQISVGSPLPKGATAVVALKDTRLLDGNKIHILANVQKGQGLRYAASKSSANTVIEKGTILGPPEIGQLTSMGATSCTTYKKPTVGVLSVGIKEDEEPNHVTLQVYLYQHSIKPVDLGIVTQDIGQLSTTLSQAVSKADIVVVTSKSEVCRDVAKALVKKIFGATIHFGTISMLPWQPMFFASFDKAENQKLFFVLPECPLGSTLCTLFLVPAFRKMIYAADAKNTTIKATIPTDQQLQDVAQYLPCQVKWLPGATVPKIQTIETSQKSAYNANAIMILPARGEKNSLSEGDAIDVILITNT